MNIEYMENRLGQLKQRHNELVTKLEAEKDENIKTSYRFAIVQNWHNIKYYEFNLELAKVAI